MSLAWYNGVQECSGVVGSVPALQDPACISGTRRLHRWEEGCHGDRWRGIKQHRNEVECESLCALLLEIIRMITIDDYMKHDYNGGLVW